MRSYLGKGQSCRSIYVILDYPLWRGGIASSISNRPRDIILRPLSSVRDNRRRPGESRKVDHSISVWLTA